MSSQLARWPGSGKFRNRLPGSSANTPLWCQGAFGNEPPALPSCRPAGGDCGSLVARPSAASAHSLGYRAAQTSPPLRPPWPFSRALRAAQARRAGALGVFPQKLRFPVAWMADLGREPERAASWCVRVPRQLRELVIGGRYWDRTSEVSQTVFDGALCAAWR